MNILKKFNLSYSAWNTYKQSQLWFFFQKIEKAEQTNTGYPVYGLAGNAVHEAIEDFINNGENTFNKHWKKRDVDSHVGMNRKPLDKELYREMYKSGIKVMKMLTLPNRVMDSKTTLKITPEKAFNFDLHGTTIKGFIDLVVERDNGDIVYEDWKTDSQNSYNKHRPQRLFYSWACWKEHKIIPTCNWVYLRDEIVHSDRFTQEEMFEFDAEVMGFLLEINNKGFDIKNYDIGNIKSPFNNYLTLCLQEEESRINADNPSITFEIRGHFVFIVGVVDPQLEKGFDFRTKFDLPGKYFMQERAKEKAEEEGKAIINVGDIGTVHLYNKRNKCFPIGLLDKMTKICRDYSDHFNKDLKIYLNDCRDKIIMNQKCGYALTNPTLSSYYKSERPYQTEARHVFIVKETGIIQMATGAGKTFTAGCIINELKAKTLWIIDRKELLDQTKEVLQKQLGIKIGVIQGQTVDIQDVTIATIQSLHSKMAELIPYLTTVNFVIVDEFHKSAATTYQKVFAKLPNTRYKLGLTATPTRDDGLEPILFSILGDVIYKIDSEELIKQGYLVKPTIEFYDVGTHGIHYKNYAEEYKAEIVESEERNNMIMKLVTEHAGKKILILTKQVAHGNALKKQIEQIFPVNHIHGSMNSDVRRHTYNDYVGDSVCNILIMTLSIGAEGLDIPDLDVVINASANAGDVKSIQVLGRVLRTFKNKGSALYIDFADSGKHTGKHAASRIKLFKEQGHDVTLLPKSK